jgi:metallo-beta-lactamase family protein
MKIQFCGASREVTGSCYVLEIADKKVLVDCGMFQGEDFNENKNAEPFPFNPKEIHAVLITHAHLDHVGRLPKLVKEGFGGKIYGTRGTSDLARLVLDDAWSVMNYDNQKFGKPLLYSEQDIAETAALFHGCDYHETIQIGEGVRAIFKDAGHIFGASFIEISGEGKHIAFSGDVGNVDVPILKDTENLDALDALVVESTYGDRVHEDKETREEIIARLLTEAAARGGTIMVPAFSIERTQEFLYELHKLQEHNHELPEMPIFLDSPLAIDATEVFKKYRDYYDEEAAHEIMIGDDFLHFPQLQITKTREDSKKINSVPGPKMVIAGAGMMNGGRILHHAERYLSDPASTLIIVGYQAEGTLGRKLYEGASHVKIHGEEVPVRCTIKAIGGLSAHADQKKLLSWVGSAGANNIPKKVFCTHGEPHAATELAHRIRDTYQVETFVPEFGEVVEI